MTIACSHRGMGEILSAQGEKGLAEIPFKQAIVHFNKAGDAMAVFEAEALLAGLAQGNA